MASFSFNQSPEDAVKYFNSKGYALTFSYADLFKDEHLTAFTIAKMMDSDLLADVQKLLDRSLDAGKSFNWFKSNVTDLLTKAGWMGRQMQFDPVSGASGVVQLGSASRIETIFRTNMQSAFAAGEWGSISDTATEFPFLMYDAIEDGRVRPEHNEWDSKVFPVNHPFWETHYPPNGYNCRCSVIQLTDDDLEELGIKPETSFDPDPVEWVNPRTGEMFYIPKGIDPSFDYNAGKLRQNMITRLLSDKSFKLPVTMRSNMVRWLDAEIKRKRAAGQSVAGYQAAINRLKILIARSELGDQ